MLTGVMGGHAHHAASWFDYIFSALGLGGSGVAALVVAAALITLTLQHGLPRRKRQSSGNERREPPWLAESLLCIFAKDIEALIGDFKEYFGRDCAKGSERRAVALYWARVLRSLRPQIWQWINRVGWAALIAAVLKR